MFQFGSSVILASGSFAVYFLSYIHYKDDYVSMQYGNIMSPIIYLFLSAFSPLSGIIVRKIGPRLTFLLSSTIVEICLIGFYFQRNLWIFYVLSLLVGVGNGFSCGHLKIMFVDFIQKKRSYWFNNFRFRWFK